MHVVDVVGVLVSISKVIMSVYSTARDLHSTTNWPRVLKQLTITQSSIPAITQRAWWMAEKHSCSSSYKTSRVVLIFGNSHFTHRKKHAWGYLCWTIPLSKCSFVAILWIDVIYVLNVTYTTSETCNSIMASTNLVNVRRKYPLSFTKHRSVDQHWHKFWDGRFKYKRDNSTRHDSHYIY